MTHTQIHFLAQYIQKFILIISSIFLVFFLSSGHVLADENNGSSDQSSNDGAGSFGEKKIQLREPLLPGQKTIDVSPDTSGGAIGIMSQYVGMIYKYVLALGSIIAVLVTMFGGVKMMTSGGDSGATGEAKDMILQTLSGLAMLFLTGLFLYAINPNFFVFGGESSMTSNSGISVNN